MRRLSVLLLGLALVLPWTVQGADWPQWRGPNRDGVSPETGLLKTWPKDVGPELVWTSDKAGLGYASPAVVGGVVYLAGTRGDDEFLICLDNKGQEKWAAKIGPVFDFEGNTFSRGPNAAPAVSGDYLVALGSQGDLVCVSPASGKEHWRVEMPRQLSAAVKNVGGGPDKLGWGFSAAPLIDGDQVIVTPGGDKGLVAALDKKSGKVLWQSREVKDQSTYAPAVLAEVEGVKMVVAMTQTGAVGVSAKNGSLLWTYKRSKPYPLFVCSSPVVRGNQIYLSVGDNGGAALLEVTGIGGKFSVKEVYAQKFIGNRLGGVVPLDKALCGFNERREWMCVDWATGAEKWSARGVGAGSLIAADGMLICLGEATGQVALAEASADKKYKETGRFTLPKQSSQRKSNGQVWAHPVLSDGLLFLRDQELVFCYKVK